MRVEPRPNEVRQLVIEIFRSLGSPTKDLFELHETVMIQGGRCLGRKYRTRQLNAVWLIDAGLIRFYDHRRRVLRTVNLFEELAPVRMAA